MQDFRLWAPYAQKVNLVLDQRTLPMKSVSGGWWRSREMDSPPGTTYAFQMDDGQPLPDPRSMWQPDGVHGRSRTVDHDAFSWTDQGWQPPPLSAAVIYEIHVGTCTSEGTYLSLADRLPYLKELGITHLELMPVATFPGHHGWGYDGVYPFAPHSAYGTPDDLKRFVDICHRHGLAVLLDVVYNHFGPDGCYLSRFGPYFTDRYATPWGDALNFDGPGSDEVRRFIVDNALMWMRDYHFDGLRIDAVHAILDTSALHILEELAVETRQLSAHLGRHLVLIAESALNDPRVIRPRALGGYGMDAQWSDDFHHALHTVLTGERKGYYADFGTLADLGKAYRDAFVYDGRHSVFRQRRHGRPAGDMPAHAFLAFIQNHDQIGNRAVGDRIGHALSLSKLEIAAALVLTSPFVPLLFQGEEWAASSPFQYFTDHRDADLADAVSRGRRREFSSFGWQPEDVPDPQAPETFRCSKLDWEEQQRNGHRELLQWYRQLIRLRAQCPDLRHPDPSRTSVQWDEDKHWFRARRGCVTTLVNLAGTEQELPLEQDVPAHLLMASTSAGPVRQGRIRMPAESVCIVGPAALRDRLAAPDILSAKGDSA